MNPQHLETLSAFLDDHPVSPEALADALAQPGGREALLDFVLVRTTLRDEEVPTERMRLALQLRLATAVPLRRRTASWMAAAAVLLAAAATAVWWRHESSVTSGDDGGANPPAVTREVPFSEGVDWFRS
jgi:hypothetical protein